MKVIDSIEQAMILRRPRQATQLHRWFAANRPLLTLALRAADRLGAENPNSGTGEAAGSADPFLDQSSLPLPHGSVAENLPARVQSLGDLLADLRQSALNAGLYNYDAASKSHYLRKAEKLSDQIQRRFADLERPVAAGAGFVEKTARKIRQWLTPHGKRSAAEKLTAAQLAAIPIELALLPSRDWARNEGAAFVASSPTPTQFPDLPSSSLLRTQTAQKRLKPRQREGFSAYVNASRDERRSALSGQVTEFFPEYPFSRAAVAFAEGWLLAFRAARQAAGMAV